jgi:hypothetical protein
MAGIHGRRRAVAIAKAEKADNSARLFWIATLTAGLALSYVISLFLA